jgi:two-component system alkaline phosphatase synthesis response regulator PhoP
LRVLLVEDYPDLAAVTADFLESEGLEVQTALSGREALDIAPVFRPQLVLCDLNLPDMTGLEVVDGLRSNPVTAQIYVAILSAIGGMELKHESGAEQHRIDAFISKPIALDTIRRLVEATRERISLDRDSPTDDVGEIDKS